MTVQTAVEPRAGIGGPPHSVITIRGLTKAFGSHQALRGIDLDVGRGQVLGLLGPNGAGKTTTVRILTTLLRADAGTVVVAGHEVSAEPGRVRSAIGLSGQYAMVDEKLTGFENLYMVGRLYGMRRAVSRERADSLLEQFRLRDVRDRVCGTYSGGMRRRLDLAGALVAEPPVVVLDEPTTGLDPRGRQDMWSVIQTLARDGTTVLLTTQYLEEADLLADSIAVIDAGRVIASGTADDLKGLIGGSRLDIVVKRERDLASASESVAQVGTAQPVVSSSTRRISVAAGDGEDALRRLLDKLARREIPVLEAAVRRPTLDDVFLQLTGHGAVDETTDT